LPFSTNFQTDSESISKYVESVSIRNKGSAKQCRSHLSFFERFTKEYYKDNKSNVDTLIQQIKNKELDPYDVINNFCIFLKNKNNDNNNNCSGITFKNKIITVKIFLEYNDVEISPRKFKLKVRYPKSVKKHKEAIDKNDIIRILNGCSDIKLKTYVMLLASTGMRATEALSIRIKDIDLDLESNPTKIKIRGEFTKTKTDRYVFITKELKEQLVKWIDFKYRKRRICHKDPNEKTITEYRIPEKDANKLLFSMYQIDNPGLGSLYNNIATVFAKTLDRIGLGSREDDRNENRREITLHSFRRFVKTTISDLGYSDYSEWFIGHSGSTYWRKKDREKAEIFKKIEPYLTFLDIQQMERQGADLQTKIEELQDINQVLRSKQNEREEQVKVLMSSIENLTSEISRNKQKVMEITEKLELIDKKEKEYEKKQEIKNKKIEDFKKAYENNKEVYTTRKIPFKELISKIDLEESRKWFDFQDEKKEVDEQIKKDLLQYKKSLKSEQ
jgi:integrase